MKLKKVFHPTTQRQRRTPVFLNGVPSKKMLCGVTKYFESIQNMKKTIPFYHLNTVYYYYFRVCSQYFFLPMCRKFKMVEKHWRVPIRAHSNYMWHFSYMIHTVPMTITRSVTNFCSLLISIIFSLMIVLQAKNLIFRTFLMIQPNMLNSSKLLLLKRRPHKPETMLMQLFIVDASFVVLIVVTTASIVSVVVVVIAHGSGRCRCCRGGRRGPTSNLDVRMLRKSFGQAI